MKLRYQILGAAPLAIMVLLFGCAQNTVQPEQESYVANLPAPAVILVHRLSVNLKEVTDNQGLFGKAVNAVEDTTQNAKTEQLAVDVAKDFADELVKQINDLGLAAQPATADTFVPANALVITGYFIDVNAGNEARRLVIGLGAGQSKIDAQVQVLRYTGNQYSTLLAFKTHADSGEMPGAAVTMGAGAAAQGGMTAGMAAANVAVGGVKTYRTAMGAMAGRSADKAAAFLSQYFAGEGWIPQSMVKKSLL
jgi:hypothetical protein